MTKSAINPAGAPRTLVARALALDGFAPFGHALLTDAGSQRPINSGSAQRFDGLGEPDLVDAGGKPCLALFRTQGPVHVAPWTLRALERHALGSQTFVPLGAGICLVVVAPSLPDGMPDTAGLQAFVVLSGQGVTLKRGTWHHPLLTLGPADVLVLERQAVDEDCEVVALPAGWSAALAGPSQSSWGEL